MKQALGALAASRKSIVAVGAIVMCAAVLIVGMILKLDKEYVLGMFGAISALAFQVIKSIGDEDSADKLAGASKEKRS